MNNPSRIYRYTADPASDSTSARIVRMAGSDKAVLDIGAGPGSIAGVDRVGGRLAPVAGARPRDAAGECVRPCCQLLVRAVRTADAPGAAGLRLIDHRPPEHPSRPRGRPAADPAARSLNAAFPSGLVVAMGRILERHPRLRRSARWIYRRLAGRPV